MNRASTGRIVPDWLDYEESLVLGPWFFVRPWSGAVLVRMAPTWPANVEAFCDPFVKRDQVGGLDFGEVVATHGDVVVTGLQFPV